MGERLTVVVHPRGHDPDRDRSSQWKTRRREVVYTNPWIEVSHSDVETPTGTDGVYGVVHFKNLAVGIIPIDEEDHTWLVGQYRYPSCVWSWEIPEGGAPVGTDPVETAHRELKEEVGLTAGTMTPLMTTWLSNSVTDEFGHLYVATDLSTTERSPDETEDLEIVRLPLAEAVAMALRGELQDSLTVMGLLRLAVQRGDLPGQVLSS